jgi:long-subunit fatty acid transport protein
VTPNAYARATFASPGVGQVFTAGAGYKINDQMKFDGAFEYAKTSGDVSAAEVSSVEVKAGSYATSAFVIHTGLSYAF